MPNDPDAAHRSEPGHRRRRHGTIQNGRRSEHDCLRYRCATNQDGRLVTGTSRHRIVGRNDGDPPCHGHRGPTKPRHHRAEADDSEPRRDRHPDVRERLVRRQHFLRIVAKPVVGRPGVRRPIAASQAVGLMGAGRHHCSGVRRRSSRHGAPAHLPLDDHRQRRNGTKSEQEGDDHQMAA